MKIMWDSSEDNVGLKLRQCGLQAKIIWDSSEDNVGLKHR